MHNSLYIKIVYQMFCVLSKSFSWKMRTCLIYLYKKKYVDFLHLFRFFNVKVIYLGLGGPNFYFTQRRK